MKSDIGFIVKSDGSMELTSISGKEEIINIFVKNLLTTIGTDIMNPNRGTTLIYNQSKGRVIFEVENALRQTIDMLAGSSRDRFDNIMLKNVKVIDVNLEKGSVNIRLEFVFTDSQTETITVTL